MTPASIQFLFLSRCALSLFRAASSRGGCQFLMKHPKAPHIFWVHPITSRVATRRSLSARKSQSADDKDTLCGSNADRAHSRPHRANTHHPPPVLTSHFPRSAPTTPTLPSNPPRTIHSSRCPARYGPQPCVLLLLVQRAEGFSSVTRSTLVLHQRCHSCQASGLRGVVPSLAASAAAAADPTSSPLASVVVPGAGPGNAQPAPNS